MTTTFGWDQSHYDSPSLGNAIAEGISFVTHKAGGDALDAELDDWWNNVRGLPASVLLGAYWVLYPGNPAGRADTFLATLDARCPGWRSRDAFILQIDAEIWGGDPGTRPSVAECNAFADRLVERTDGKYRPAGYLPRWVYPSVTAFRYPLWASSYVSGSGGFKALYPGDGAVQWNGYGRPVDILQFSSKATIGGRTTSDANAFRGTLAQLKALVTPGAIATNGASEDDDMSAADAQLGFMQALWAAEHYRLDGVLGADGKPIDETYAKASDGDKKTMRQTYTLLRNLVGGPTDLTTLVGPLKEALTEALPGDLADSIGAAVEAALERVRISVAPAS